MTPFLWKEQPSISVDIVDSFFNFPTSASSARTPLMFWVMKRPSSVFVCSLSVIFLLLRFCCCPNRSGWCHETWDTSCRYVTIRQRRSHAAVTSPSISNHHACPGHPKHSGKFSFPSSPLLLVYRQYCCILRLGSSAAPLCLYATVRFVFHSSPRCFRFASALSSWFSFSFLFGSSLCREEFNPPTCWGSRFTFSFFSRFCTPEELKLRRAV